MVPVESEGAGSTIGNTKSGKAVAMVIGVTMYGAVKTKGTPPPLPPPPAYVLLCSLHLLIRYILASPNDMNTYTESRDHQ